MVRAFVDPGAAKGINAIAFDKPLQRPAVLEVQRRAETFQQKKRGSLRDRVRRWFSEQK